MGPGAKVTEQAWAMSSCALVQWQRSTDSSIVKDGCVLQGGRPVEHVHGSSSHTAMCETCTQCDYNNQPEGVSLHQEQSQQVCV